MGALFHADFGDPNQVANGVFASTIPDGTAITSVSNALGGPVALAGTPGTGSITLSTSLSIDGAPVLVMQGNSTLVNTVFSSVFTSTNGNNGRTDNGAWGLTPWTVYAVMQIVTVSGLCSGLLVGKVGDVNAVLSLGGSAFGGNGSRLWIAGNGSALASYPSTDFALPTAYYFAALTFNGSTASAFVNGKNVAPAGLLATNWGNAAGIADPGFGLAGTQAGETFGAGGGTRFAQFGLFGRELSHAELAQLCSYLFSLYPSQQL